MAIIQSDNPGIEKHLNRLEALIEEGGGGIHSKLVIVSENGGLGGRTLEPLERGREIIRLTRKVLLADDQFNLVVKGDNFTIEYPEGSRMTDLQKRLAECMADLYNETDKVRIHKKYSFLLTLLDYPEILDMLEEGRMFPEHIKKWRARFIEGLDEKGFGEYISETFLKTRYLGYSDHIRVSNVSVLMPMIDFLNHHWDGAGYSVIKGVREGDLTLANHQPLGECTECFAFYGVMDALDCLIRYDFADVSVPIVRSVPIVLEVPGVGKIEVAAPTGGLNRMKLAKSMENIRRFMPVMVLHNKEGEERRLKSSHIIIPADNTYPRALRRVLNVLLNNLLQKDQKVTQTERAKWIADAEHAIIEQNIAYYKRLKEKVQAVIAEKGSVYALENLISLANSQIEKLAGYRFVSVSASDEDDSGD